MRAVNFGGLIITQVTDHWFYDRVCSGNNVAFLKSTYKDNPF